MLRTDKIGVTILRPVCVLRTGRRLLKYSDKVFELSAQIEVIKDRRKRPRIKTQTIFSSALVMSLFQLGRLNALEQAKGYGCFWKSWIGGDLPSADTMGRVFSLISSDGIRQILKSLYSKLKRNKSLKPAVGNKFVLIPRRARIKLQLSKNLR